jgi:hypothetical protein
VEVDVPFTSRSFAMSTEQAAANANTTENRDAKGRFTIGNAGGAGNPFARQVAALRQALINSITPEDIQAVAKALIQRAAEGNVQAAKLLFSYAIGKPQPAPEPDHMDADEWDVYRETVPMKTESAEILRAATPEVHLKVARMMRPVFAQMMGNQMAEMLLETPEQREAREDAEAAEAERVMNSPAPELPEELERALNGERVRRAPSPNGVHGGRAPSANGNHGGPAPSPNGVYGASPSTNGHHGHVPPSTNGDRMPNPVG